MTRSAAPSAAAPTAIDASIRCSRRSCSSEERLELGRIRRQPYVNVGAPPDQSTGGDEAAAAVTAGSREHDDVAAGDVSVEHRAREPGQVGAGVLHHPGQRQPELDRNAVDVAHLSDANPADRAGGAAFDHGRTKALSSAWDPSTASSWSSSAEEAPLTPSAPVTSPSWKTGIPP